MADILNANQIGEIIDAFKAIDLDQDGVIESQELGHVLRLLGQNPTVAELQVSFGRVVVHGYVCYVRRT